MSIDQGMLERTRLVNHGTLDELKIHLAETPLDQDMAQEELNRLLVRSLLAGDKEKFDYLALPQSEVEKKPLADISALYNDNIKKYLTPSDFNIGDPPFTGIRGADIGTRLQASHDILDAIHENQYGADKIQIHMPIMAAYFGHSILMDKLIQEAQENKIWDFNTSITLRPATALALAINLTTGELNDPYDQMARNMIQTANEEIELIKHTTLTPSGKKEVFVDRLLDETEDNSVTGLKISSQFLAISTLFGNGEFDRTQEYLNLMGTSV